MIYCLEMMNTENYRDIRYREYTTSKRKVDAFRGVPKIQFTDSGHGVVATVSEHKGKKLPAISECYEHVWKHMAGWRQSKPEREINRRAAACLQACAEYDTEALEDGAVKHALTVLATVTEVLEFYAVTTKDSLAEHAVKLGKESLAKLKRSTPHRGRHASHTIPG